MIRRPPRSTLSSSSAASDVYKRQSPNSTGFNSPMSSPRNDGGMMGGGMMSFNHSMGDEEDYMAMASSMNGSITNRHRGSTPAASTNTNIDAIQGLIHHQAAIRRSLGLIKEQVAKRPPPRPTTAPSSPPAKEKADDTAATTTTEEVAQPDVAAAKEDSTGEQQPQTARTPVESVSSPVASTSPAPPTHSDAAPEK
eukprot:TRINITY_DN8404_c0_g1_i4.p1 TRINITY_DN8404_c0_g1~~TRINITY_DN8404_c0_g1_i4.p1  ORF type:complete len:196 (+),score=68.69 TRINITY_DN8404_c0_g1_i4:144-731(+)